MADDKKKLAGALNDQLKGTTRSTIEALASRLGMMPSERAWVTVDVGSSLASVSLKASVEFFKSAPEVARLLDNRDLAAWAELGRRIALSNADEACEFFHRSPEILGALHSDLRPLLIALCSRQVVLSAGAALTTFCDAARTASTLGDLPAAVKLFEIAVEVAHRSVKHSTEVLTAAPQALQALRKLEQSQPAVACAEAPTAAALQLAESFARRTGATAAEFLTVIAEGVDFVERPSDLEFLCAQTSVFLERGGATALQYFRSARAVMQLGGTENYNRWDRITSRVAEEGNAIVYDFLKLTPRVLMGLAARQSSHRASERIEAVLDVVAELTGNSVYMALECFKSAPRAVAVASLEQFRAWAHEGAGEHRQDRRRAQAYYALESKTSQEKLRGAQDGVALESVAHLLRLYVEGLTGRELVIAPIGAIPDEAKINDGRTIQLPSAVAEFGSAEDDFRLYKVLAAHAAGQVEFGTRDSGTPELRAAVREIDQFFTEKAAANGGHKQGPSNAEADAEYAAYSNAEHLGQSERPPLDDDQLNRADYKIGVSRFPNVLLATRIFTTLENGRIDYRLRRAYRGIRRDLDFVQQRLIEHRPPLGSLPVDQLLYELLFQITLCGGVHDDLARRAYGQMIGNFEEIVESYLRKGESSVADTLIATQRIYALLGEQRANQDAESQSDELEDNEDETGESESAGERRRQSQSEPGRAPQPFDQWSQAVEETVPTDTELLNELMQGESGEQELLEGDQVFFYDEWDRELSDLRARWCRVIRRENRRGSRDFVEQVRARYSGVISSIRHQFQLLKPESLRRVKGELDGEDFDLEAVIDHHVDLRTKGRPSERLYIRRIRRERDVAVSFLLDMSSSTARTISRHPNQPYSRPGQKIIDIEKQGLVLMSEALEAVGDAYAISGFTSEGRRNVKYFVIKSFGEKYSESVERKIGGITYHNNTRLGAAIRHAAAELERQDARTKLLIVLSDGRPYDHDYGDSRYAREDTKTALRQTQTAGITSFCITIDRESEAELKDLYGEVGYTIIDDVMSLPERLPGIYRRLTT